MGFLGTGILACAAPEHIDPPERVDEPLVEVEREADADGDGYPAWSEDAALVDCDDEDPSVTPLTERYIPAGWFVRGDERVEVASGDQYTDAERPAARDILLSGYCLDVYEVTNLEFVAFMESEALEGRRNETVDGQALFDFEDDDDVYPERILDLGDGYAVQEGYEDHPVAEVWFHSADAYCTWAGQRVPTEAEWEKGARGEEAYEWPWGLENATCDLANTVAGSSGMCVGDTAEVGLYADGVSPYGLHDMTGNIGEWVADWYSADFYAEGPEEDPFADEDEAQLAMFPEGETYARIARGGSFALGHPFDRTFARFLEPADATSNGLGFRCARDL